MKKRFLIEENLLGYSEIFLSKFTFIFNINIIERRYKKL